MTDELTADEQTSNSRAASSSSQLEQAHRLVGSLAHQSPSEAVEARSAEEAIIGSVLRLSQSGRATQRSKSRPAQLARANFSTRSRTLSGYLWQSRVFVPRTHPL